MIDTSEKIRNHSRLTLFLYASRHFLLPDPLFPPVVAKLNPNIRAGTHQAVSANGHQDGTESNIWFENVDCAVAKKVGPETVCYVGNIYK